MAHNVCTLSFSALSSPAQPHISWSMSYTPYSKHTCPSFYPAHLGSETEAEAEAEAEAEQEGAEKKERDALVPIVLCAQQQPALLYCGFRWCKRWHRCRWVAHCTKAPQIDSSLCRVVCITIVYKMNYEYICHCSHNTQKRPDCPNIEKIWNIFVSLNARRMPGVWKAWLARAGSTDTYLFPDIALGAESAVLSNTDTSDAARWVYNLLMLVLFLGLYSAVHLCSIDLKGAISE